MENPTIAATTALLQLVALMLPVIWIAVRFYFENVPREKRTETERRDRSGRLVIYPEVAKFAWATVSFLVLAGFLLSVQLVATLWTPSIWLLFGIASVLLAFISIGILTFRVYSDMMGGIIEY